MASWNTLPYEIKLHVARYVIDSILAEGSTRYRGWDDRYDSLRQLLAIAPEIARDLEEYCRKCQTAACNETQRQPGEWRTLAVADSVWWNVYKFNNYGE